MINQQDIDTAEYFKANNINYSVVLTRIDAITDDWKHDKWICFVNGEGFEYSTGTGHRLESRSVSSLTTGPNVKKLLELTGCKYSDTVKPAGAAIPPGKKPVIANLVNMYTKPPTQASVLYSLLLDADSSNETFSNWCDNYGYTSDSLAAQRMYFACQENSDRLNKALTPQQRDDIAAILEDY